MERILLISCMLILFAAGDPVTVSGAPGDAAVELYARGDTVDAVLPTRDRGFIIAGGTLRNRRWHDYFKWYSPESYIRKHRADGSVVWQRIISYANRPRTIDRLLRTDDDGVLAVEFLRGDVTGKHMSRFYRFDASGMLLWQSALYLTFRVTDILQLSDGGFVAAGTFVDRIDYYYYGDAAVLKLDAQGNRVWFSRMADRGNIRGKFFVCEMDDGTVMLSSTGVSHYSNASESYGYSGNNWLVDAAGNFSESVVGRFTSAYRGVGVFSDCDGFFFSLINSKQLQDVEVEWRLARADASFNRLWERYIGRKPFYLDNVVFGAPGGDIAVLWEDGTFRTLDASGNLLSTIHFDVPEGERVRAWGSDGEGRYAVVRSASGEGTTVHVVVINDSTDDGEDGL